MPTLTPKLTATAPTVGTALNTAPFIWEETAMLGDKLLTDMLGANRSGVLALMVEPRGGAKGAWNKVLHLLQRPWKAASAPSAESIP